MEFCEEEKVHNLDENINVGTDHLFHVVIEVVDDPRTMSPGFHVMTFLVEFSLYSGN